MGCINMSTGIIISIARQYGSGGRKIGQQLAKDLNLPFYDKELIALAAQESGISVELFEKANEKASSSLLYSLVMGSYTFGNHIELNSATPINDKLFVIQSNIIKRAAQEGPCVIVGRCADYVLREYKNILKVFVHADQLTRMDTVVMEYGVKPEAAAEFLAKKDKQRANYYNFYTNKRWDNLENYDLTIDSSVIGIEKAVELIKSAAAMMESQSLV
jgi:CMP/dCMP kinase